jgi:hypothetical protein
MRRNRDIPFRPLHAVQASIYSFNPSFAADLFFLSPFACLSQIQEVRSTGSKQTLNGLFIFIARVIADTGEIYNVIQRYFVPSGLLPGGSL